MLFAATRTFWLRYHCGQLGLDSAPTPRHPTPTPGSVDLVLLFSVGLVLMFYLGTSVGMGSTTTQNPFFRSYWLYSSLAKPLF